MTLVIVLEELMKTAYQLSVTHFQLIPANSLG